MTRSVFPFLLLLVLLRLPTALVAQGEQRPPLPPPKPDTAAATMHVEAARKAAGTEWADAVAFMCKANPDRAPRPTDPVITPTKIFDNVYAIGVHSNIVYAVTTSAGIVLIESGYTEQVETVLVRGLRELGLNPADVRYVLLGHGHADHFGGAKYFQDRGARVVLSAADWDFMDIPARRGGPPPVRPKRDMTVSEGQTVTVGDMIFTVVEIPGHTPGSLGYIFPVKDGARTHIAGFFGGTVLTPFPRLTEADLRQYVRSAEHFREIARAKNVDVELQNHPLYDHFPEKLERLKTRRPGQPHPFVVGREVYPGLLTVMAECAGAQIERLGNR